MPLHIIFIHLVWVFICYCGVEPRQIAICAADIHMLLHIIIIHLVLVFMPLGVELSKCLHIIIS